MYLVIGAGLSGCVVAERIAKELNKEVHIIDRRNHVGGNIHDYVDENGVMVHTYGPHAFHTNHKQVWDYLSQFTEWKPYFHHVEGYIDGQDVPIPFNFNTIEKLFPQEYANNLIHELITEFGINKKVTILELLQNEKFKDLAQFVYEKVFLGYTQKQWDKKPEELDISVSSRVPIYTSKDDRYFQDTYQAIPEQGYTKLIENMIQSPLINVSLETDFSDIDVSQYEKIIYTGMIDEYFNYSLGKLPYRSLEFTLKTIDKPQYQNTAQKNYSSNFDFTRITEYKHFLDQNTEKTTIALEYPKAYEEGINEPYYPIPSDENHALYVQYRKLAKNEKNVIFLGRLAEYKYYNMDQIVKSALYTFEKEIYVK
ncbi:UDP-galactopyranose mutase [Vibrio gazogenes]|uniref:UDP-galactopyranose mutase n=1 Tax=Vibrio gazogenes TaxID=687 RepID=A0A1Z2SFG5_VIBGA|nr:UDP-galactopyranose mutase [Vibrio gazogenes]ASA55901.1 UDP-galactopyranose mutase [Vibrio gazogenes]